MRETAKACREAAGLRRGFRLFERGILEGFKKGGGGCTVK